MDEKMEVKKRRKKEKETQRISGKGIMESVESFDEDDDDFHLQKENEEEEVEEEEDDDDDDAGGDGEIPGKIFKIITKKIIVPEKSEIDSNPRSRSAKFRVAERTHSLESERILKSQDLDNLLWTGKD